MKSVFLNLLVCTIALLHESNGSKLLIKTNSEPFSLLPFLDDSVSCTAPGSYCNDDPEDCDSIFLCLPGQENPIKTKCATGQTCNNGKCSVIPSALCEYHNKNFRCQTTGMFPEPSSCKEYNICCGSSGSPEKLVCDNGYAYNPFTTFCDIQLKNDQCDPNIRDIPPCLTVGQNGPLMSNPVLYYVCLPYGDGIETLYPFMHKCPHGQLYVGDFICQ